MVFSKLSTQEKDAFFGLLDEYFQSRPELFGQSGGTGLAGTGISTAAATSVVQRALASSASNKSNNPYAAALATSNREDVVAVGRVAAASLAFSQQGQSGAGAGAGAGAAGAPSPLSLIQRANVHPNAIAIAGLKQPSGTSAPSLPRRTGLSPTPSLASASASVSEPGSEVDKLVTRKTSVLSAFKKQQVGAVSVPPAFIPPKNSYGPPPVRRTTSESGGGAGARATQHEAEERVEGEWAEVLYDYSSEDPGDLAIEAGTRVFVTEKPSQDWWKGEVEGREGLFPASYVKIL